MNRSMFTSDVVEVSGSLKAAFFLAVALFAVAVIAALIGFSVAHRRAQPLNEAGVAVTLPASQ